MAPYPDLPVVCKQSQKSINYVSLDKAPEGTRALSLVYHIRIDCNRGEGYEVELPGVKVLPTNCDYRVTKERARIDIGSAEQHNSMLRAWTPFLPLIVSTDDIV